MNIREERSVISPGRYDFFKNFTDRKSLVLREEHSHNLANLTDRRKTSSADQWHGFAFGVLGHATRPGLRAIRSVARTVELQRLYRDGLKAPTRLVND